MSYGNHYFLAWCDLFLGIQLLSIAVLLASAFRAHPKIAAGQDPKLAQKRIFAAGILLLPLLFLPWFSIPLLIATAVSGIVVKMVCWVICKIVAGPIPPYGRAVVIASVAFSAAAGAGALAVSFWAFSMHLSRRDVAKTWPEAVAILVAIVLFIGVCATSGVTAFMLNTTRRKAAAVMAIYYVTGFVLTLGLALLPSW